MRSFRVLVIFLLMVSLFFMGCTKEGSEKLSANMSSAKPVEVPVSVPISYVQVSEKIQESPTMQESKMAPTVKYSKELPACPTDTATGCRKIPKSEQKPVEGCVGRGTVALTSPMKYEDIGIIIPMGATIGGHVTPIDHMYFQPIIFHSAPDSYGVVADADGIISSIGLEGQPTDGSVNRYNKYRIVMYHSCDFYSIYNLITSLSPRIMGITGVISAGSNWGGAIPVKRGELLGKIGGQTLDLSVNYDTVTLDGFLNLKSYDREPWKIHTVDPFDYWEPEVREKLLEKNIRKVAPLGGKIDYDVEGRLVGNWFVEGTNGYQGNNPHAYWDTHLAFVYNEVDPTFIIVSVGDFAGEPKQFAVRGNVPNPATVRVSSGVIKYELVDFDYTSNGKMWDHMSLAPHIGVVSNDFVRGVILVEMIESRTLKVEVFPDKKAGEVLGFTANAKVYVR